MIATNSYNNTLQTSNQNKPICLFLEREQLSKSCEESKDKDDLFAAAQVSFKISHESVVLREIFVAFSIIVCEAKLHVF